MRKQVILAAALTLALAWASPAAAATIQFDTNGTGFGGLMNAAVFDWAPGNSLIIESTSVPNTARILFQANLNVIQAGTGSSDFLNGTNGAGSFFTAVAAFDVTLGANGINTVVPGAGVLKIYADNERGNNLSGLDFTTDAGAIEILSATLTSGGGTFTFGAGAPVQLDQYNNTELADEAGGDNYPGKQTLPNGLGVANITGTVNTFNSSYFLNLVAGTTVSFTNSSQIDPYNQANPSGQFSMDGIANGGTAGVSSVGPVNGQGNNIIAQSDANTSFVGVAAVPEPATLTLLGLGLAGSAAARRRQKRAQQQA